MTPRVVVTRHEGLVELLAERGIVGRGVRVVSVATDAEVVGADVIVEAGTLPLRLASLARSVTEIPIDLPSAILRAVPLAADMAGRELTACQLRPYVGRETTYRVLGPRARHAFEELVEATLSWVSPDDIGTTSDVVDAAAKLVEEVTP